MREFFATLTKPKTIQLIILVMIIASILAIIFTLVVILIPNLFPEWVHIRESVLTLATCSMVLATLILAFGTFSIIMHDREREHRQKRELCLSDIIEWATDVIDFTAGQTTFSAKDLVEIFKSSIPFETVAKTSAHDRHVKLNKLSSKAVFIVSLRELLFPNSTDLNLAIHKVRRKIYEHLCFLTLEMNGRVKNTEKSTQLHLRRLLDESISLVIIATDLYTKIK